MKDSRLSKILSEIQDAEGIRLDGDSTLFVREDEVLRLILQFAFNIHRNSPEYFAIVGSDEDEEDEEDEEENKLNPLLSF